MVEMPLTEFAEMAVVEEDAAKAAEPSLAFTLLVALPLAAWAAFWYSLAFLAGTLVERLGRGYRDANPKQLPPVGEPLFETTEEGK